MTDPGISSHLQAATERANATALKALNLAREAFDDAGHAVSIPGEGEPGEFYVEIDGLNVAVKIELI